MSFRPFSGRKKNRAKNMEALEVFRVHNKLDPTTRLQYERVIKDISEMLIDGKKSLWDVTVDDIKKYFLDNDTTSSRTALTTFYRELIKAGYYKRDNPVTLFIAREKKKKEQGIVNTKITTDETASLLQQLDESDKKVTTKTKSKKKKRVVAKSIITNKDLDRLLLQTKSIRDRTILIFLFATGIKLKELTNLTLKDVDISSRQVKIKSLQSSKDNPHYRTILLPRRTISYLKVYEKWRKRILAPVEYYFITTGQSLNKMSESAITNWLKRIQKGTPIAERWTAMDFRKRALLQQYWISRDLTAVARFGGYKRPESALRLIAETLEAQGVDSIEKLTSISEFDRTQKTKTATVSDLDGLKVTIELEQQDLDFIANSGQTPTQFIRSLIRYGGRGGVATSSSTGPVSKPETTKESDKSTPSAAPGKVGMPTPGGAPKIGMPTPGGGPNLSKTPSGGPNLSKTPSGGPNLSKTPSGGPNLSKAPSGGPSLGVAPKSTGPDLLKGRGPGGPSTPGGAPPSMSSQISAGLASLKKAPAGDQPVKTPPPSEPQGQMGELKALLARRKAMADAGDKKDGDSNQIKRPGALDATIRDVVSPVGRDKNEDDAVPDLPDFDM